VNIYEEETVEQKFEALTDQIGYLLLDLILISVRRVARENQVYSDFVDVKRPVPEQDYPF
jgi:ATP-dependent RNA circularization protein (DNA/RNA ligase family)